MLHEEDLGWDLEGNWRGDYEGGSYFPWMDERTSATAPVAPTVTPDPGESVLIPELDMVSNPDSEADLEVCLPGDEG